MGPISRALAAEWRRRWSSWIALSVLIALAGGSVMAGAVAARRTSSAFPDFVQRYSADVGIYSSGAQSGFTHLAGAPARLGADLPAYVNANVRVGTKFIPSNDISMLGTADTSAHNFFKLLSGRWPTGPNDALVGFSLQQLTGVQLGSVIHVPLYSPGQATEVYESSGTPPAHGPDVALRVVGFSSSMLDFPTPTTPTYTIVVGHLFATRYGHSVLVAHFATYRLLGGASALPRFTYDVNHLSFAPPSFVYPFPFDGEVSSIEVSIAPQVTGWWLFALLAFLAGLALVGQALARQSLVERESYPTLSAIGFTPSQLFRLGVLRGVAVGALGAVGAVGLAYLVSPLTPVGEARAAALTTGWYFDGLVLGLGFVAVILLALLLSIYPSWRAAQVRQLTGERDRVGRPSALAVAAARSGAPPTVLIGMRHALEAGRGRGRVPVATALAGTIAAVCALSATSVFGASLGHLLHTPPLYGQNWNLEFNSLTAQQERAIVASAVRMPGVERVTDGVSGKVVDVSGASAVLLLTQPDKGTNLLATASGSLPTKVGEVALGSTTLASSHSAIGSTVEITTVGPGGMTVRTRARVTGTTVFPGGLGFLAGLGDGIDGVRDEAYQLICGNPSASSPCGRALTRTLDSPAFTQWGVVIQTAPTPAGARAEHLLEQRFSKSLVVLNAPTNLVNFGGSVNFPLLLGAMAALFGAAALAHLLLVSVARRRRELALLKVLGFVRRQAAATVCWQSATVVLVGVVVGVPAGIALGRVIWRAFVANLGAVPSSVVPVIGIVVVGLGALACAVIFAAIPAALAARLRPAEALREA